MLLLWQMQECLKKDFLLFLQYTTHCARLDETMVVFDLAMMIIACSITFIIWSLAFQRPENQSTMLLWKKNNNGIYLDISDGRVEDFYWLGSNTASSKCKSQLKMYNVLVVHS